MRESDRSYVGCYIYNERLKVSSEVLGGLPLAMLDGSPGIRQAIELEAQRVDAKLNVRLRFSSYPQLAGAVANLEVAAIMRGLRNLPLPTKKCVRLPAFPVRTISPGFAGLESKDG